MDPLSVLGLVANIVQLVDAAINAFTLCRQVYTLGASIEDTQMTYTSNQLITCYSSLQYSLKNPSTAGSQVRGEDADLNDLATQCCNIAELLHEELESLRKTPGGGIRKTSVKLFLKKKKSKRIDKLKDRLDEYQKVLDSKILIKIRHVSTNRPRTNSLTSRPKARSRYSGITIQGLQRGT